MIRIAAPTTFVAALFAGVVATSVALPAHADETPSATFAETLADAIDAFALMPLSEPLTRDAEANQFPYGVGTTYRDRQIYRGFRSGEASAAGNSNTLDGFQSFGRIDR